MQKNIDRFGNILITFTESIGVHDLDIVVKENPTTNALMLIGISHEVAKEYNDSNQQKLEFYFVNNNMNHYLLRNQSTCPQLCNEKIFSSSAVIIVEHNNKTYALFGKDKTKPFATLIGGTANHDEYDPSTGINFLVVMERELLEETTGPIEGIHLFDDILDMEVHATIKFKSTLFGKTDIDDKNRVYHLLLDDKSEFMKKLFSPENKIHDNYRMAFRGHSEIEYILAIKLDEIDDFSPQSENYDELSKIMTELNKMKGDLPVSKMAWFLTFVYVMEHNDYLKYTNMDELKKLGFPPGIQSIKIY